MYTALLRVAVRYLLPLAAVGAVLYLSYTFAFDRGYAKRDTEARIAAGKLAEEHADELARQRGQIEGLVIQLGELSTTADKEKRDAQKRADDLRAELLAARVRFTVPVVRSACRDAGDPTPADQQTRAELDPATAVALVGITDDGDAAIRDLGRCIDAYNAVRNAYGHH